MKKLRLPALNRLTAELPGLIIRHECPVGPKFIHAALGPASLETVCVCRSGNFVVGNTVLVEGLKVTNIYVGNLSFRATDEDIRKAFTQYGQVTSVNIVMDQDTGRSRGFAFVEMANANEASEAIAGLNEQEIASRRVIVNEARPREEATRGGSQQGGGGGGGRHEGGGGRYRDSGGRESGGGGGGGGRESGGRRGNYSRDDR